MTETEDRLLWIAGLDPGDSSGLLVLRVTPRVHECVVAGRWQGHPREVLSQLEKVVRQAALWQEKVIIAAERFTTTDRTGKRTAQPTPQRVLGAAEQLSYTFTNVEFTLQSPADAKKFAPNVRLRELGFYSRADHVGCPDANDVNDAARHAVLGLARYRPSTLDVLLLAADRRRTESQR